MVEFVYEDNQAVQINLEKIQSTEELLRSLHIHPEMMRFYPMDRRPYIEFSSRLQTELKKIYINNIK